MIVQALELVEMILVNMIHEQGGDVQLPADRDPSVYETSSHVILAVESDLPDQRRLSYSILLATTRSLKVVLIHRHHYRAVNFEIFEEGFGRLGRGRLRASTWMIRVRTRRFYVAAWSSAPWWNHSTLQDSVPTPPLLETMHLEAKGHGLVFRIIVVYEHWPVAG